MENSTSNNGLEKFQNIYFTVCDDLGSNKEIKKGSQKKSTFEKFSLKK